MSHEDAGLPSGFRITTARAEMDVDAIHAYLTRSYWAEGISRELVARALDHSLCFGLFEGVALVGFARLVTDRATYAYLADVFILEPWRGRGLSKALMAAVMAHPDVQGLRGWSLKTRDAHELYRQFGFTALQNPARSMEISRPGLYLKTEKSASPEKES